MAFEKLGDVLRGMVIGMIEKKTTTENKNMNVTQSNGGARQPRVLDLNGSDFLRKKGLRRDQANYVSTMIKYRADLLALLRITNEQDIRDEIETMVGMVEESIGWIYGLDQEPPFGPIDAA